MRLELLLNPRLLCERLATESIQRRRRGELRGTVGECLSSGHIDSLELLKLARKAGIHVIYDIGANVGTWTLLAKSLIPAAHIHAFEPLPRHQTDFLCKCFTITDVTLHPIAVGSDNSTKAFHVTDFSDASSLLRPTEESWKQFGVREVNELPMQVFRLDDYKKMRHLPNPDLIKLDIQGYELEALRGCSECLESTKAVLVEVSFIEYYERQCLFHEVVSHLGDFGLFVQGFGFSTPTGNTVNQTDVLFMRRGGPQASGHGVGNS